MKRTELAVIEPLERRQLQTAATAVTLTPSATKVEFGTTVQLVTKVTARKGKTVPKGVVHLLYKGTDTGLVGSVSTTGLTTFEFGPNHALNVLAYSFSARFVSSSSKFTGSKSKAVSFTVTAPTKLKTNSYGVQAKTIHAGKGAAVKSGQKAVIEYTCYNDVGALITETTNAPFGLTLFAQPEQAIIGLDDGVVGMKVGEVRVLEIPTSLAFGDGHALKLVVRLDAIK